MSATTKSRARREPITAPVTMPALDGSSKASAGDEGVGIRRNEKWVAEKNKKGRN